MGGRWSAQPRWWRGGGGGFGRAFLLAARTKPVHASPPPTPLSSRGEKSRLLLGSADCGQKVDAAVRSSVYLTHHFAILTSRLAQSNAHTRTTLNARERQRLLEHMNRLFLKRSLVTTQRFPGDLFLLNLRRPAGGQQVSGKMPSKVKKIRFLDSQNEVVLPQTQDSGGQSSSMADRLNDCPLNYTPLVNLQPA
uniref:Uncharacterized protein n=1 Tax=Oryza brachyantha TaxID=4533 RepID=J3N6Y7_ORYBR